MKEIKFMDTVYIENHHICEVPYIEKVKSMSYDLTVKTKRVYLDNKYDSHLDFLKIFIDKLLELNLDIIDVKIKKRDQEGAYCVNYNICEYSYGIDKDFILLSPTSYNKNFVILSSDNFGLISNYNLTDLDCEIVYYNHDIVISEYVGDKIIIGRKDERNGIVFFHNKKSNRCNIEFIGDKNSINQYAILNVLDLATERKLKLNKLNEKKEN